MSVNQISSNQLLSITMLAIDKNSIDDLKKDLKLFDLNYMDPIKSNKLLSILIDRCMINDRKEAGMAIIERWKEDYFESEEYKTPFITNLFKYNIFRIEQLRFVAQIYDTISPDILLMGLMNCDQGPELANAFYRIIEVYGEFDYYKYELYHDEAVLTGNGMLQDLITLKFKQLSPTAPKPDWLIQWNGKIDNPQLDQIFNDPNKGKVIIPYYDQIPFPEVMDEVAPQIPSDDDIVNMLTSGYGELGTSKLDLEKQKNNLYQIIALGGLNKKIDLMNQVVKSQLRSTIQKDIEMLRILGPANPDLGGDLLDDHICNVYGGHRMFLCNCFVDLDDTLYGDDDLDFDQNGPIIDSILTDEKTVTNDEYAYWFTGTCDQCSLKIASKYHAVRRPLPFGGWKNQFCCFKCLKDYRNRHHRLDILMEQMIVIVEEIIKDNGIYDRIPRPTIDDIDNEEPPPLERV